jgi:hypothetical protein
MQGGHSTASPANQTYIEPHELDISDYIEPHELDISDYIEPHELDISDYIEPHELDISEYIEPYSELNISTTSSTSSPTASSTSRPHRVHRALQRARHLDLHRVLPDRPPASTANQRAQHLRALQRAQQSLTRTTTTTPIVMGGVHPRQPSVLCTPTL